MKPYISTYLFYEEWKKYHNIPGINQWMLHLISILFHLFLNFSSIFHQFFYHFILPEPSVVNHLSSMVDDVLDDSVLWEAGDVGPDRVEGWPDRFFDSFLVFFFYSTRELPGDDPEDSSDEFSVWMFSWVRLRFSSVPVLSSLGLSTFLHSKIFNS